MHCCLATRSLSAFTLGFESGLSARAVTFYAFLAPAVLQRSYFSSSSQCAERTLLREPLDRGSRPPKASEGPLKVKLEDGRIVPDENEGAHLPSPKSFKYRRGELSRTSNSQKRIEDRVFDCLDPYLPIRLRVLPSGSSASVGGKAAVSAITLPGAVERHSGNSRLFRYLALNQRRLSALLALTKALLRNRPRETRLDLTEAITHAFPLLDHKAEVPLAELTGRAMTGSYYDYLIGNMEPVVDSPPTSVDGLFKEIEAYQKRNNRFQAVIGEILETLGFLILEPQDQDNGGSESTLHYIQRILAVMHSENAMPDQIYEEDTADVPYDRRKPPYLHALSPRIIAVMSDSVWQSADSRQDSNLPLPKDANSTLDVTNDDVVPRNRGLGSHVWLELILWTCIHGNHFIEAGRILMRAVFGTENKSGGKWSMLGWEEVQKLAHQRAAERQQAYEDQSWITKLSGPAEAYSDEASLFEMPPLTISREVVIRTVRSFLLSNAGGKQEMSERILEAFHEISKNSTPFDFDSSWNCFVGAMSEGHAKNKTSIAGSSAMQRQQDFGDLDSDGYAEELAQNAVATEISTLHWAFFKAVEIDNVSLSVSAFRSLLACIDAKRQERITNFNPETYTGEDTIPFETRFTIPHTTRAKFLEMVTRSGRLELASWLVYSSDPDGPFIPSKAVEMPCYQPALVRYAAAQSDWSLFSELIEILASQSETMPPDMLNGLFESQVVLRKFTSAHKLVEFRSDEYNIPLSAGEIAILGCEAMKYSKEFPKNGFPEDLRNLIEDVFQAKYQSVQSPWNRARFDAHRKLYTMIRMFYSLGGELGELAKRQAFRTGHYTNNVQIDVESFNTILKTVAALYGHQRAFEFFELWTKWPDEGLLWTPRYSKDGLLIRSRHQSQARVIPNAESLRILSENLPDGMTAYISHVDRGATDSEKIEVDIREWVEEASRRLNVELDFTAGAEEEEHDERPEVGLRLASPETIDSQSGYMQAPSSQEKEAVEAQERIVS